MEDDWDDDEPLINFDYAVSGQIREETQRMEDDWDDDEPLINFANAVPGQFRKEHVVETQRLNETWGETDDEPLINIARKDSTVQGTSDDDNIPLSSLARNPADNHSIDPDWCPCTSAPSSEEGDEQVQIQPSQRKNRKRHNKGPILSNNEKLKRVKTASAQAARKQALARAEHESKLNNILSANGYYKTSVPSDGNCFFGSASLHLDGMDPLALRSSLCDHLDSNFASYIEFLSCEGDENERYLSYILNVEKLRTPGTWTNDAADLLPLALADMSGRHIKIFTSDPYKPVLFVRSKAGDRDVAPITLSLLEVEAPHYEAVFEIARHTISDHFTAATSPRTDQPTAATSPRMDQPTAATSPGTDQPTAATSPGTDQQTTATSPRTDQPTAATSPGMDQPTAATSPGTDQQTTATSPRTDQPTAATSPQAYNPEQQPRVETPRQQGNFTTPPKKQLFREKTATPGRWKKSSRKKLRLEGKEYNSESGNVKRAKILQHVDCTKCRFKCHELTAENRQDIFQSFYGLASYERQKDFICSNVLEKPTKTFLEEGKTVPKKRQICRTFSFNVAGTKQRICKKMFMATLDIGEAYVEHALRHGQNGSFTGREERGRHTPYNKTPEKEVERAKKHIESFPVVESHYTRKDSQRKYLAANLNIAKMYELHKEETQKEGVGCVTSRRYRSIFNQNYNLSFHVPKKDQCAKCTLYATKQKCGTLTEEEREIYKEHLQKKEEARKEKASDKEKAKKDPSLHVITVDMQAVLQAPCGAVSQLYYKRKLSVYNFTTYSLADGRATCYTWDETEAKRGACEIATCLFMYVSSLPKHVKDVIIYSDCCGGQNRNQYLATCFMHAVNTIPHINTITHKYLETGHTHMECDSMHSAITSAKKHTPIFTPSGWDIVFRQARRNKPYLVLPLKFRDVVNFKEVAHSRVRNTKTDTNGHRVKWLRFKSLQFRKGMGEIMFFKYSHADEDHLALRLIGSAKRGRPDPSKPLPRLYSSKLPISEAKKRDLLSMCQSEIIPQEHHPFYKSLAVSAAAKDSLAEPDMDESDQDTN